jgi:putative inorganic carbon (hco3(-)) transporter
MMPLALFIPIIHHLGLLGWAPLVIYFGAIAAFIVSVSGRPHIGLYFVIPFYPLQTLRYRLFEYPFGNKLIYISLLGVLLGVLFSKNHKVLPKNPLNKIVIPFAFVLYFSLWYGALYLNLDLPLSFDNPRFENWINYMVMPLTMILVVSAIKTTEQIKTLYYLLCGSCVLAARSVYSAMADRSLGSFSYGIRDAGVFGGAGANGAGAFFAWFSLVLIAVAAFTKKKWLRWSHLALAGYCMYDLLLTFSRGAYLAVFVGLVVLAIIKERKIFIFLIPFVFTWQLIVPGAVRDRITMTYDSSNQLDSSAQERVYLWEDSLRFIQGSPVMGSGYNTYPNLDHVKIGSGVFELNDPHNYYLKVVIETGVIGLFFFLAILASSFRISTRLYKRARDPLFKGLALGLIPAVIAIVIANLFGDRWEYLQDVGFFWALIGCAVRGLMITQQQEEAGKPTAQPEVRKDYVPELYPAYPVYQR